MTHSPFGDYRIVAEYHASREAEYEGRRYPSLEFQYAIRRGDGSLAFRADTHALAAEILANLEYPEDIAA